jgi:hypothetical protein
MLAVVERQRGVVGASKIQSLRSKSAREDCAALKQASAINISHWNSSNQVNVLNLQKTLEKRRCQRR